MSYSPMPGSKADKCLRFLRKRGLGAEVRCSDLAEAAGCSSTDLHSTLSGAMAAGLVRKVIREGVAHYVMPGKPGAPVERSLLDSAWHPGHELEVPTFLNTPEPAAQQVLKAEAATPDATDRAAGSLSGRQKSSPLRIALWSDGALYISGSKTGQDIALDPDETRQLFSYLDHFRMETT